MSSFLDGVNRVLRTNAIISDNDDDIQTFNDTQHKAALNLAIIAIQNTLTELVSNRFIPYEEGTDTITWVAGTRVYDLATDFVRFIEGNDWFLKLDSGGKSENTMVLQYPKGEKKLRNDILDYDEQSGDPFWWYFANGTTKQVGFYHVPDSTVDGKEIRYRYEKSVYVTSEADTLPFTTQQQDDAFLSMCARYFQFLFAKQPIAGLLTDTVYSGSKANLSNLMRVTYPSRKYGWKYR